MTHVRRSALALAVLPVALLSPAAGMRAGVIPVESRFAWLVGLSALCAAVAGLCGHSFEDCGVAIARREPRWSALALVAIAVVAAITIGPASAASPESAPNWPYFLPFYAFISAPCQEFLCRALPKLAIDRAGLGKGAYLLYSSGLFAGVHLPYGSWELVAATFVLGLCLGCAYLVRRSIWPVAFAHAVTGLSVFYLGLA